MICITCFLFPCCVDVLVFSSCIQRIREFYQNANLGSNIQDVPATGWVNKTINPIIISVSNGWNVVSKDLEKVND